MLRLNEHRSRRGEDAIPQYFQRFQVQATNIGMTTRSCEKGCAPFRVALAL